MSIQKKLFGTFGGENVYSYKMTNISGASVAVLDYGGIIQSLFVPDREGCLGDVVCGFDTMEDYLSERKAYFGAIIGRCGNRISGGGFNLGDKRVFVGNNENIYSHLHGGYVGFNRKIWKVEPFENEGSDSLELTLFSPDMEEGYPGNLYVRVTYTFADDNSLEIHYEAQSDEDTYVNLTNHAYYNLNGFGGGSVMKQKLWLNADRYDNCDEHLIPCKEPSSVEGTVFDFRKMHDITCPFDHNFHFADEDGKLRLCCSAWDEESGRTMDIITDQPCVQLYTAVGMNGKTNFKGGVPERLLHAFCLETQYAPDLPNRPNLKQRFLLKGEKYDTVTKMVFGIR